QAIRRRVALASPVRSVVVGRAGCEPRRACALDLAGRQVGVSLAAVRCRRTTGAMTEPSRSSSAPGPTSTMYRGLFLPPGTPPSPAITTDPTWRQDGV